MRFSNTLLGCATIVEAAISLQFTNPWTGVVTGVPLELTWIGNNGAVNITLQNGTTANPIFVNLFASKQERPEMSFVGPLLILRSQHYIKFILLDAWTVRDTG